MDDISIDLISLRPTIHRHDECITLPDLQHAVFLRYFWGEYKTWTPGPLAPYC